jgi:uncharacterized cupin superfamily protein
MRRVNLLTAPAEYDAERPEGYARGRLRLAPRLGASALGGTIYELPAGQSICPYHYEYGNEEWVIVLAGRPVLRHPGGEEQLETGDAVCFPEGPEGAHQLFNRTADTVRVLMLSTQQEPSVAVYPDSDKIGVWPGDKRDNILVRRESVVDYWDREAEPKT